MAPQKTEAMGVAILTSIFQSSEENIGTLALPIVVYHTIQVIIAAAMVGYLQTDIESSLQNITEKQAGASAYQALQTDDVQDCTEDENQGYGSVFEV
mmetsp:Transcript_37760/g.76376  ORF Transcript_37760/g.76376 Transcript_37760/m.76376 type:complete len:97 (+) Transcript_37760:801-1091(+)